MHPDYTIPSADTLRAFHPDRALIWPDFADLWLNFPLGKVLDYGCGPGELLARIAPRCTERFGVDIDPDKVSAARNATDAHVQTIDPTEPLPFPDASFDTIVIVEVIEHVSDERAVLTELARVLAPGGRLLLTTPHRGLLTFLDPGNFKFIAPGVHRFVHRTLLRQRDYYDKRFGDQRRSDRGMVADFTTDQRPWHRHYSYSRIRTLAPENLATVARAVYYPAFRALWTLRLGLKVLTLGKVTDLPAPLRWCYRRLSRVRSRLGDQLLVLFEKTSPNQERRL